MSCHKINWTMGKLSIMDSIPLTLCLHWELHTREWVGRSLPHGPWEEMKSPWTMNYQVTQTVMHRTKTLKPKGHQPPHLHTLRS